MNESDKPFRDALYYKWTNNPSSRPSSLKEAFEYGFNQGAGLIETEAGPTPVKTEWVLVECVQTYLMRYMVEVPEGKAEWALDTVSMNEAKEFSQQDIGETIASHRVISEEDALKLCDIDNDYCKSWSEELKIKSFFTKEGDKPF